MTNTTLPLVTPSTIAARRESTRRILSIPRGSNALAVLTLMALLSGILIAAATTRDPLWWQLHFSQLGTFGDFSSRAFNSGAIASGTLFAAYAVILGCDLPARIGRRTRRAAQGFSFSTGAHMAVIGMIPIPVSPILHDLAALGLALSLLALLCTGFAIPHKTRRVKRFLALGAATLVIGMVVLTLGFIPLSAYELVAFTVVSIWLGVLPRLGATQPSAAAAETAEPSRPALQQWPAAQPIAATHVVAGAVPVRNRAPECGPRSRPARRVSTSRPHRAPARASRRSADDCTVSVAPPRHARRGHHAPADVRRRHPHLPPRIARTQARRLAAARRSPSRPQLPGGPGRERTWYRQRSAVRH